MTHCISYIVQNVDIYIIHLISSCYRGRERTLLQNDVSGSWLLIVEHGILCVITFAGVYIAKPKITWNSLSALSYYCFQKMKSSYKKSSCPNKFFYLNFPFRTIYIYVTLVVLFSSSINVHRLQTLTLTYRNDIINANYRWCHHINQ